MIPPMNSPCQAASAGTTGLRTVAVVAYDGIEILDAAGPIEVFEMVNRTLRERGEPPAYALTLLAGAAGPVTTAAGVRLVADAAWEDAPASLDTLVVVGSPDGPLADALADRRLIAWLRQVAGRVRRLVSVCTGAFLLAEAGLLSGRRVTTHWLDVERLGRAYPALAVEPDAIYVRDGAVATSAGVTTCLDLTLALVEEDFGREMALAVARRLVLFLKRPGGQAQYSTQLRAQATVAGPLAPLLAWLGEQFRRPLTVEELAARAAMSPRNFARVFARETGMPPARYLEQLRFEQAVRLLEDSDYPLARIAVESGFASAEHLRRAFRRRLGVTPRAYRERF